MSHSRNTQIRKKSVETNKKEKTVTCKIYEDRVYTTRIPGTDTRLDLRRSTLRFEFRNKICSKVLSKACTHANSTHGNPKSYYRLQHTLFYILQTKVNGLSCPTFHSILILTIFFALPSELFPVSKFDANPLPLLCCSKNESGHTLFLFTSPTLKSTVFN